MPRSELGPIDPQVAVVTPNGLIYVPAVLLFNRFAPLLFIPIISFDTTPLPPFIKGDFSFLKKSLVTMFAKPK